MRSGKFFFGLIVVVFVMGFGMVGTPGAQQPGGDSAVSLGNVTIVPVAVEVLARIGERVITRADIEWRIDGLPPEHKRLFQTEAQKKELLDRLISNTVFAEEARELKIDKQNAMIVSIEDVVNYYLAQAYIKEVLAKRISVSDEEIGAYYTTNKNSFKVGPMVKIRHILVAAPTDASYRQDAEALRKAKQIRAELAKGADFAAAARKHSDDRETAPAGGELPFVQRAGILPDVGDAAFKMKKGEISRPVRSVLGYHIIMLDDRKEAGYLSLQEASADIRATLLQQKEQALVQQELERLKTKYNVTLTDKS